MSVISGPDIVRRGLVFHVDPADPKCYSGGATCRDLARINGNGALSFVDFSSDRAFQMNNPTASVVSFTRNYTSVANQHTFAAVVFCPSITNINGSAYFLQSLNASLEGITMGFYSISPTTTGIQFYSLDGPAYLDVFYETLNTELLNKILVIHGVMNGNISRLYINGSLKATATQTGIGSINVKNNIKLGFSSESFIATENGLKIYKAMIYNRALSDLEVLQNYNAIKGRARLL